MSTSEPPKHRSFIFYNPERIDYSVTGEEFEQLCRGTQSLWKDFCLVFASLGIPCLINAIADTQKQQIFSLSLSLFLNYLVGVLGLLLAVVFGIVWANTHRSVSSLVHTIKSKPKMEITPSAQDVGALVAAVPDEQEPVKSM